MIRVSHHSNLLPARISFIFYLFFLCGDSWDGKEVMCQSGFCNRFSLLLAKERHVFILETSELTLHRHLFQWQAHKHFCFVFFLNEKWHQVCICALSRCSTPRSAFDHTTTKPCWYLQLPAVDLLPHISSPLTSSLCVIRRPGCILIQSRKTCIHFALGCGNCPK